MDVAERGEELHCIRDKGLPFEEVCELGERNAYRKTGICLSLALGLSSMAWAWRKLGRPLQQWNERPVFIARSICQVMLAPMAFTV